MTVHVTCPDCTDLLGQAEHRRDVWQLVKQHGPLCRPGRMRVGLDTWLASPDPRIAAAARRLKSAEQEMLRALNGETTAPDPDYCPHGYPRNDPACTTCIRTRRQSAEQHAAIAAARKHLGLTWQQYVDQYGQSKTTALRILEGHQP